jgi:O-antigen/teichoic acid export membrane protein
MKFASLKHTISNIKKRLSKKLFTDKSEGSIFKNMAKLTVGTGLAKIVGVVTAPIITRIYLPEDMGILSIYVAVISIIIPLGTLKYSLTIPIPKNDGLATNIVFLCSAILTVLTLVTFIILFFFSEGLLTAFNISQLIPYWWFIPFGFLAIGFYEILTNWAIREKAYKQYSRTIFWQSFIGAITKISLGLLGIIPIGLIIGQIFNQAGGIITLIKAFSSKLKSNLKHVTVGRILFIMKRYSDYPKYRIPAQFMLAIATKAPLLFFAWHFSIEETGQLGLSFTMLAIPMSLFGSTTANAFFGEIAKLGIKNKVQIYKLTKSITKKLFLLSILPFLVLLLLGPWLFEVFFGTAWREAGVYSSILSVFLITQFIYSPIGNGVFNIFHKQTIVLLINAVRLILVGSVFFLTYYYDLSTNLSLGLYSICLSLFYLFSIFIVFRILKHE